MDSNNDFHYFSNNYAQLEPNDKFPMFRFIKDYSLAL